MACSPKREAQLVKDVQARRRAFDRADKLPRSQLRSKLLKTRRAQVVRSEEKLAECRQSQMPAVRQLALELMNHKRSSFAYVSPTGGSAKVALRQLYSSGEAKCAATGRTVKGDGSTEKVLRFCIALCDEAKGMVQVNCILNGSHRAGSLHYSFHAVDIGKNGTVSGSQVQRVANAHGCGYLNEDQYHWHCYAGPGGP